MLIFLGKRGTLALSEGGSDMLRLLIVLLLLAAPAEAVTFRLTGSEITSCIKPDEVRRDPCARQLGRSFDGRVRLDPTGLDLTDNWLYVGSGTDADLPDGALRFRLPGPGDKYAGLYFNETGALQHWWLGKIGDGRRLEVSSFGLTFSTPRFLAQGNGGRMVPIATTPIPPAALMLLTGLVALRAIRRS
jgi:hypothetical protein